jgi:hypothetical protein
MRLRAALLTSSAILLLAPAPSRAAAILDQSFDPGTPSAFAAVFGPTSGFGAIFQDVAQTFTVGVSGQLTQIDILMTTRGTPPGDLILDVRSTTAGVPNEDDGSVLGSIVVPAATLPPASFVSFDLSGAGIQLAAGDVVAFVLRSRDSTLGDDYWIGGGDPGGYAAGDAFLRQNGSPGTWQPWDGSTNVIDLGFKTYMLVPEPGTGVLLALGLVGLAARSRQRP